MAFCLASALILYVTQTLGPQGLRVLNICGVACSCMMSMDGDVQVHDEHGW
jgi:hypothetical protein